jgi:hypothetical protein
MKTPANQLPLLVEQAPKAASTHERIELCTRCCAEIVVQRYTGQGLVSGYRSRTGECLACSSQPNLQRK